MIQQPFCSPTRYIRCPACGKGEFAVSHLPVGTKTAWYCDECGVHFHLHVLSESQVETAVDPSERIEKTLVTLRSEQPVTILLEGMRFVRPGKPDDGDHDRYFYEEHSCPTNWLRHVLQVRDDTGDDDPHGIFAYVKTEAWRKLE
jgi:hypothetical protein